MRRTLLLSMIAASFALACGEKPTGIFIHTLDGTGTIGGGSTSGGSSSQLSISPSAPVIRVGQTVQLLVNSPSSLLPLQIAVDRSDIAPVSASGLVTGVSQGVAIVAIRSTVDTTQIATSTITVQP